MPNSAAGVGWLCVAILTGFVPGMVFTVCMPSLLAFGFMLASWLVAGLVAVFVALNAYEVSMALQKRQRELSVRPFILPCRKKTLPLYAKIEKDIF